MRNINANSFVLHLLGVSQDLKACHLPNKQLKEEKVHSPRIKLITVGHPGDKNLRELVTLHSIRNQRGEKALLAFWFLCSVGSRLGNVVAYFSERLLSPQWISSRWALPGITRDQHNLVNPHPCVWNPVSQVITDSLSWWSVSIITTFFCFSRKFYLNRIIYQFQYICF